TFNQLVAGSNPARPTNSEKSAFWRFFRSVTSKPDLIFSPAPSPTFALSRFNTAPIVITLFSERLYGLVRPLSAVSCAANVCVF
ncbi:hypothetical protein, partial [Serratia marcescens]|uniref:hypothetical protein n=1 Tax=Serratia marcescens TaxID=615 RepID=UPI0019555C4C